MVNPSTSEEVKQAIADVSKRTDEWAKLDAKAKLALLEEVWLRLRTADNVEAWVKAACVGHGYQYDNPAYGHLVSEIYFKGPAIMGNWMAGLVRLYTSLAATGKPPAPLAVNKRPDGRVAIKVTPGGALASVAAAGTVGELFLDDEKVSQVNPLTLKGGVTGVLGAGNFDGPTDILHVMFLENQVCVFKSNPVNAASAPAIAHIFKPLIDAGFLRVLHGGIEPGTAIVKSPLVERLHMTGSCKSYDAIVWGDNKEKKGEPALKKHVTAELGSVNPYIIVPGKWSDKELDAHAQNLVCARMFNNGHVCAAPQVVVVCGQWPQREKFMDLVRHHFTRYPSTVPFYPNCNRSYDEQLQRLKEETKKSEEDLVVHNQVTLPEVKQQFPILALDVKPGAFVTKNEAFCPVLSEVRLDTEPTAAAFLPAAAKLAHEGIWGSLTCTVIIDPVSYAEAKDLVEKIIDELQFGAVGINTAAANAVVYPELVWGAYPRHTPQDVQSGLGKVGNIYCMQGVLKAVVRAPFTSPGLMRVPTNPAFQLALTRRAADFFIHQNPWRLVKLLSKAILNL